MYQFYSQGCPLLLSGHYQVEGRPAPMTRPGLDDSVMVLNYFLDQRKAYTRSMEFFLTVETGKDLKNLFTELLVKTDSVVPYDNL